MPTYSPPTVEYIKRRTGLNRFVENFEEEDIDAKLRLLRADVEPEVEINVTTEVWTASDLSPGQVVLLKRAVAYRTAAAYLISPGAEKLTGTQEPLLMGEADEILDFAARLEEKAAALETKLATGAVISAEVFAMPYVLCSTYPPSATPTPSERIAALDVRDDCISPL
jgi:hypothetical protein